jgi:hypothetical protein
MRGTQLAQLNQEYYEVQCNLEIIRQSLEQKQSILPEMKDAVKDAQKNVEKAKLSNNLHETAIQLEAELQWTVIVDKERVGPFLLPSLPREWAHLREIC